MNTRHVIAASALLLSALSAQAQSASSIVVNGSLDGNVANKDVPSGWMILEGTPDVMDVKDNIGVTGLSNFASAPKSSANGGTWVGLGANDSYVERFGQTLNGLVTGQTYTISWEAANFGILNQGNTATSYTGSNAISVLLDGVSVGHGATLALSSNWTNESLTFVATSSSQQLSFRLASGEKSYLSIDGIAVKMGGTTPAVPEPGTWALMSLGLIGMGAVHRRRKAV